MTATCLYQCRNGNGGKMSDELKACPFCKNSIEKRKRNNGVYAYHKATDICTLAGLWISADLWQSRPIEDALLEAAKNMVSAISAMRSFEDKWLSNGEKSDTEWELCMQETQDAEAMIIVCENQLRAAIAQAEPDKAEGGEG
jgi:hypothetical protein